MRRRFGKLLSLLLALCMLLALLPAALASGEGRITRAELAVLIYEKFLPTPTGEDPGFTDIGDCSEEQQAAIIALTKAGIVNGMGPNIFVPAGRVTRAQAALIIWRALGQPTAADSAPYTDIPDYAAAAVNALYEQDILTDDDCDAETKAFSPDVEILTAEVTAWLARIILTRAEFARLLYEKFRPAALPPENETEREETAVEKFPDIDPVAEGGPCTQAQRTAINVLYAAYILDGQSDGNFNPMGTVTRAEAVVLIWRAAGRGSADGNPSDIFNNVPANYQPAFDYLVSLGVLTEADAVDGEFGLNRLASFADVTHWLSRLLTRAELAERIYNEFMSGTAAEDAGFTDIGSCTEIQEAAINALAQADVIAGTQQGKFAPNVPVTYGAAAIVLCRAASGDSSVKDLDLALAYLEVKGIVKNTAGIQPGSAIPPETMGSWLDRLPEPEMPGDHKELALDVASGNQMVVEIQLKQSVPEGSKIQVLVAQYDNGQMTAVGMQEITVEKLCLLTLPDGSGTTYRVFLLDGGQSSPLCAAAETSVPQP